MTWKNVLSRTLRAPERIEANLQYNVVPIRRASELKPGDHIRINYWVFDHHLLVVKVLSDTKVLVLNYAGPEISCKWPPTLPVVGEVIEEVREIDNPKFAVSVLAFRDPPETLYTAEEAFERARTRLGERQWRLFTNNCEHLVNWALTGVARSSQVDVLKQIVKYSLNTTLTVGIILVPLLGILLALAIGIILVPLLGILLSLALAIVAGTVKGVVLHTKFRRDVNRNEEALREEKKRRDYHQLLLRTRRKLIPQCRRYHVVIRARKDHLHLALRPSSRLKLSGLRTRSQTVRLLRLVNWWLASCYPQKQVSELQLGAKFFPSISSPQFSGRTPPPVDKLSGRCGLHEIMSRKVNILKPPFLPPEHIVTTIQYDMKTISHLSELRPGDHVKVHRHNYDHHLLVVKVVNDEELQVIHYTEGDERPRFRDRFRWPPRRPDLGKIAEEVCKINSADVTVLSFKNHPEKLYSAEEAFERARKRLGENRYGLFVNNCEHFVNWALTGVEGSSQVDAVKEAGKDFLVTSLRVGVFLGPTVGAAAGVAKAVSSYKQYRNDVKESEKCARVAEKEAGEMEECIREREREAGEEEDEELEGEISSGEGDIDEIALDQP